MKHKVQKHFNLRSLLLGAFLLILLIFVVRSGFSSSPSPQNATLVKPSEEGTQAVSVTTPTHTCTKLPPSLSDTIIHYATSNITPQQTIKEISVTARVLQLKSPCKFLVFGLGHDSLMWAALNQGGRTVFLEEDAAWIETIRAKFPTLEAYHVAYDTKVTEAEDLMVKGRLPECEVVGDTRHSKCRLALKGLPALFYDEEWDLIMVDAPTGWIPEAPGRMGAIYTAGMAARGRSEGETDVFVHDVDRVVEDNFSKTFLCEGYLKQQEGRLRHFTIPSHRTGATIPFCPS